MAIENIIMRKIARELQEWIYLGIEDGMIQSTRDYLVLSQQGRTVEAEAQLSRAVDMPFRAIARIEELEKTYTSEYIDKCLALYGDCTLKELKDDIIKKQATAKEWVAKIIDTKIENTEVASEITSTVESNAKKYLIPIPSAYVEIVQVEKAKAEKEKVSKAE